MKPMMTRCKTLKGHPNMTKKLIYPLAALAVAIPGAALAQDATPVDNAFIFNTLLFLIGGFLVFWMAAGFAMLEAGLVRSKNVTMQLTKNMGLFAIAAIGGLLAMVAAVLSASASRSA